MKHEWRKKEKTIYLPKNKPELIELPAYKYIVLSGAGNPNNQFFSDCIGALYSVAYSIKMMLKKMADRPTDYVDWTVYPLEGIWDLSEHAKKDANGKFNKDDLVFDLMIRQPNFINEQLFDEALNLTKAKKPHDLLADIKFKTIEDGKCVQMLHVGSYDDEPVSFALMEAFAANMVLTRKTNTHREIYLSDFRKVAAEKLKTVLRFQVE